MALQCLLFFVILLFCFIILLPLRVELRFSSWVSKEPICARFSFNHFAEEEINISHLRQGYIFLLLLLLLLLLLFLLLLYTAF